MNRCVRKEGARPIHLLNADGTLRCRRDIQSSNPNLHYDPIDPGEMDWQDMCVACMKTPSEDTDFEALSQARSENRIIRDTLYHTRKPTRKF